MELNSYRGSNHPILLNMNPIDVQFVVSFSGYFVKDLQAVRQSPQYNPLRDYNIPLQTPGFKSVVQAGQIISILLHLPTGVAVGDCVDVIFSRAASRDPLFVADEHLGVLESVVKPWVLECDISSFRRNGKKAESRWLGLHERCKLHSAIRYGLTQALLAATAQVYGCTITEVISHEWAPISDRPIDILASCHRNDTLQLDRMIMKQASLLPHTSSVHISDVGPNGSTLVDYVRLVAGRVRARGSS